MEQQILNIFFQFIKTYPVEMFINIIFMLLIPIQDVLLPHYYGTIISDITVKNINIKSFVIVLVIMILLQIGFYIGDWHDSIVYPKLQKYIRANMLSKILKTHELSYKELNTGEIISSLVKIPGTISTIFERLKNTVLPFLVTFIVSVIYFMCVDNILGLSLFIFGILFMITIYLAPINCNKTSTQRDKQLNVIYEEIDDIFRNLFSIYGSNKKESELQRCSDFEQLYQNLFRQTVSCIFRNKIWMSPISIIFLCVFVLRTYTLIQSNTIQTSKFVSIFMIMFYLLNSMMYTNDQFRDIVFEWGIIQSANKIVFEEANTSHNKNTDLRICTNFPNSGLGLYKVKFQYPNTRHLLFEDITLHIEEGEKVVITGDIGSGKSTILKLFLKYHEPISGCIYWNGHVYNDIDIYILRKKIGYVPQVPILFNRSIIENMTYGVENITREELINFLQKHDILKEFSKLDKGIDTIIGKNGSLLSGGQRQLIWCIRIILMNPAVLILDEPTSSIDTKTKEILINLLDSYMKDKTVIMVTHDEFLLSNATRKIHMMYGKIIRDEKIQVLKDNTN